MERIDRKNLHRQIVDELGLRIVRGLIHPYAYFPNETDLSTELGVSRTVTREAIRVLAEKGMVAARPRSGTQALPRERWSFLDADILHWEYMAGRRETLLHYLTEVRLIIEPAAAELAALRATPEECDRMDDAFHMMEDEVEHIERYIEADIQFHAAIVYGSHNEIMAQIINVIREALVDSRLVSGQVPGSNRDTLPHHFAVLQAIRDHQSELAFMRMRGLILRARDDIRQVITVGADGIADDWLSALSQSQLNVLEAPPRSDDGSGKGV